VRRTGRPSRRSSPRVGSPPETGDAVLRFAPRRQHQHGQAAGPAGLVAQPGDQGQAVLAGHHHVQDRKVELQDLQEPAGGGRARRGGDPEPRAVQEGLEKFTDAVVVVDHEEVPRAGGRSRRGHGRNPPDAGRLSH
jgi:hypothetical protein